MAKSNTFILLLTLLFSFSTLIICPELESNEPDNCLIITIPKSGTHLFVKYFHILLKRKILPFKTWDTTHFFVDDFDSLYNACISCPEMKAISLIRDPRDIICSLIDWLEKIENYSNTEIKFRNQWYLLSRKEKLRLLIDASIPMETLTDFFVYCCHGMTLPQRIKESVRRAALFNKIPGVLVLRFEDVVGVKGKGCALKQRECFDAVNKYLNITVHESEFGEIVDSLWGSEDKERIHQPTFFKGYIGRWKEEFDETAVTCMKMHYSELLRDLGYEADDDWDLSGKCY